MKDPIGPYWYHGTIICFFRPEGDLSQRQKLQGKLLNFGQYFQAGSVHLGFADVLHDRTGT